MCRQILSRVQIIFFLEIIVGNLGVIMVKLKKHQSYERNEMLSNIRPAVILQAATILANSEVYLEVPCLVRMMLEIIQLSSL